MHNQTFVQRSACIKVLLLPTQAKNNCEQRKYEKLIYNAFELQIIVYLIDFNIQTLTVFTLFVNIFLYQNL